MKHALNLPRRPRGRMSPEKEATYAQSLADFCEAIIQIDRSLDFKISTRGWCYMLEDHGLDKGDFGSAEALITQCRKDGDLPLDICARDGARAFDNLETLDETTPEEEAQEIMRYIQRAHLHYQPISFWSTQQYYCQMMVEKIDLKSLFSPVCAKYSLPIANARGSADLNSRADMMKRFAKAEAEGRQCVLLYCGDHDPAGLRISDFLPNNLADLSRAVGWSPDNLIVDRFGLNYDFIKTQGLSWINNLETGSGRRLDDPRHRDHNMEYVQTYLDKYGARKVEANALVTRPEAGRQLCEDAILKYIDLDRMAEYEASVEDHQEELREEIARQMARYVA